MADTHHNSDEIDDVFDRNQLFMNEELFQRFRQLKDERLEAVSDVDESITQIQQTLMDLRDHLEEFSPEEQNLMSVLIARSIKRSLRELLIQDTDLPEQP